MSVLERQSSTSTSRPRNKLLFRPRRRFRHLKGLEAFRLKADPDTLLYYEIRFRNISETIRSERVRYGRHIEWEALDFTSSDLPASCLHGYYSGIFEVVIFSLPKEKSKSRSDPRTVLQVNVDLNEVVFTRKAENLQGVYFRFENGLHGMPSINDGLLLQRGTVVKFAPREKETPSRADSRSEGSDCSFSRPASSSNDGTDIWTEGQQDAKLYNTMERRVDIRRLSAAQNNLQELIDRKQKLNLYLLKLLKQRKQRVEAIHKLKRLKQLTNEKGIEAVNVEYRLAEVLEHWTSERDKKLKTVKTLQMSCSELREAVCRLIESSDSFSNQIVTKSNHLHSQLVARRCNLISSMATSFGLRPYEVNLVASTSPELETVVDKQWWRTRYTPIPPSPFQDDTDLKPKTYLVESKGQTYLGIVGMDLSPGVVGMIENGFVEWSLTQGQRECIEAALDVPLRYPIRLLGSRSMICLPSSSRLAAPSTSRELALSQPSQQFPLFFQGSGGAAKRRLTHGFTLLDRNIQQVLATHGLKSNDRSCLLQNLDALVSASRSGIRSKRDQSST